MTEYPHTPSTPDQDEQELDSYVRSAKRVDMAKANLEDQKGVFTMLDEYRGADPARCEQIVSTVTDAIAAAPMLGFGKTGQLEDRLYEVVGSRQTNRLRSTISGKRKLFQGARKKNTGQASKGQADELWDSCQHDDVEFWRSTDGGAYCTFPSVTLDGVREHAHVGSEQFSDWLRIKGHDVLNSVPKQDVIKTVADQGAAEARMLGKTHTAFMRVGEKDGCLYLDLGDRDHTVIEIDGDSWRVATERPDIKLVRGNGLELPMPETGGSLDDLRELVTVADEDGLILLVGALVNMLRPQRTYPILILTGEAGAAKSTAIKMVHSLVDPIIGAGGALAQIEEHLIVTAINNYVISGDNLSGIDKDMADALCRLATGGGISKRKFYTDGTEWRVGVSRPVVLGGISLMSAQPDLLNRAALVELRKPDKRMTEDEFWRKWQEVHPKVLGLLLDGLSASIKYWDEVDVPLPRMADFVRCGEAAGRAFGWEPGHFAEAFDRSQKGLMWQSVESDPVAHALWQLMGKHDKPLIGTAQEIFQQLEGECDDVQLRDWTHSKRWPNDLRAMGRRLKGAGTALAQQGIAVEEGGRDGNSRTWTVRWTVAKDQRPEASKEPDQQKIPF